MIGLPFCSDRWSEVAPFLFVGGHDYLPDGSRWPDDVVVGDEFDLVISLYHRPNCGPDPEVRHEYLRIPDGPLTLADRQRLDRLADLAADHVHARRPVLIRCQAGYNRSALVAGLVLLRLGATAHQAIAAIQDRRSRYALHNEHFCRYLRDAEQAMAAALVNVADAVNDVSAAFAEVVPQVPMSPPPAGRAAG